jgi:hypothetical protein
MSGSPITNRALRVGLVAVFVLAVMALLWFFIFPWVEHLLPSNF